MENLPENDVNDEGIVMPSISDDTPLPGQPDPSEQLPDENEEAGKSVPLAALHEERQKRQELQAELEVLRQIAGDNVLFDINGRPVPQSGLRQVQQHQQPQNDTAKEIEELWEKDPRKAVQVEIMAAMSWRDNQEAQVENQIASASHKYTDFNEYSEQVRSYVRSLPLDQRAKSGVVDLAYFVVKGQNAGTAVERAKAEMMAKMKAGQLAGGLTPGTKPAQQPSKGTQLNEEQLKVADAMGLTPEQYMSAMKQ